MTENSTIEPAVPGGPSGGAGLSARQMQMRSLIQAVGMLPVLILLCIAFHYMADGRFFTAQNISIVAQQASINTVLAAGHDLRHPDRRHRSVGRLDPGRLGNGRRDHVPAPQLGHAWNTGWSGRPACSSAS